MSDRSRARLAQGVHSPRTGLIVGGIVAGLILAAALLPLLPATEPSTVPPVALPEPADSCRTLPAFTMKPELGLAGGLALATDRAQRGLVMLSTDRPNTPYQHPSWDDAGYLGPITYDRDGHIYAAPTPRLSLVDNPLEGATTLWRVDSASGVMKPFVALPGMTSMRNPYAILGLSYACTLHRLYAGTVIGSTPAAEQGGVVAIDLMSGQISSLLEATDVMGLLVDRMGSGYALYIGLARSPELLLLPLDSLGQPTGPLQPLLDLTTAGATASERARKLRLVNGELTVDLVPFNYSLQTSAAAMPNRVAAWRYDASGGAWVVSRPAASP
jgi:hypothetical protein